MNTTSKKDQAQEHVDRAKDSASSAADKAREAASHVGQAARDAASTVGQTARDMASSVGQRAEGAVGSVGSGMESLGEKVRESGPQRGVFGSATEKVAGALESGGKYLQDKNLSGMGSDLADLIRNNPIPALLVGVGLGFLLARTMRS
jgi:hypothetical protein